MAFKNRIFVLFVTILAIISLTLGQSVDPQPNPVVPQGNLPVVEGNPLPDQKVPPGASSVPVSPSGQEQPSQGNGYITEQKNPDGSTLTITRFNGPFPSNAFPQNPFVHPVHERLAELHAQTWVVNFLRYQQYQQLLHAFEVQRILNANPIYSSPPVFFPPPVFQNPFFPFWGYPNGAGQGPVGAPGQFQQSPQLPPQVAKP